MRRLRLLNAFRRQSVSPLLLLLSPTRTKLPRQRVAQKRLEKMYPPPPHSWGFFLTKYCIVCMMVSDNRSCVRSGVGFLNESLRLILHSLKLRLPLMFSIGAKVDISWRHSVFGSKSKPSKTGCDEPSHREATMIVLPLQKAGSVRAPG